MTLKRTYIVEALKGNGIDKEVLVKGWVRTRRDSKGGFSFIELNDGSCFNNLQIVVDADLDNYQDDVHETLSGKFNCSKGDFDKIPGWWTGC